MKKVLTISALIAALSFAGCSSSQKKAGPFDSMIKNGNKTFASKKFTKPKPWAPGQYVVMATMDDGEIESVTKSLVVRKEAGGWVYETITINDDNETTGMQMLVKGLDTAIAKGSASQIKVIWVKMLQKDGKVEKIEGDALTFYNMILQSTWNNVIISGTKFTAGGAVKVPGGNFAGTTKVHTSVKVVFTTLEGDSYLHPDVPINGVVKSVVKDDSTELIDFGFNGKAVIQ
jgi:hypothetical protein